jgi:hypothetical protein
MFDLDNWSFCNGVVQRMGSMSVESGYVARIGIRRCEEFKAVYLQ